MSIHYGIPNLALLAHAKSYGKLSFLPHLSAPLLPYTGEFHCLLPLPRNNLKPDPACSRRAILRRQVGGEKAPL